MLSRNLLRVTFKKTSQTPSPLFERDASSAAFKNPRAYGRQPEKRDAYVAMINSHNSISGVDEGGAVDVNIM